VPYAQFDAQNFRLLYSRLLRFVGSAKQHLKSLAKSPGFQSEWFCTIQLKGKVERSHRSDSQEFYQLPSYKGDVDLEAKPGKWQRSYSFARPHGAFYGKTH